MQHKVYLEIPAQIALGLASGRLERIGGIIRDRGTKQVVAWLRESGQLAFRDPDVAAGLLRAMQQGSGSLASVATGVLDAAVTARSHHILMRQMAHISRLSRLAAVTGVLNLGLGAISFVSMIQHANKLAELIRAEAERDRKIERETVVEYLELLKFLSGERRVLASELAVLPLIKSRKNLLASFEEQLAASRLRVGHAARAIQYLVLTMQLDVLHARSYLDTGEAEVARHRLKECLKDYENRSRLFVKRLLGKYPAKYFHGNVSGDDFQRFLLIEEWLRGKEDVLEELYDEYRKDFWNSKAARELKRKPVENLKSNGSIDHITALTLSELLIENMQRLKGYELEIATMRMSVDQWDRLADLEERDFAVIVDLEGLDNLDRIQN